MVIIDTNILIDHLRRKTNDDSLLMQLKKEVSASEIAFSLFTVQELYAGKSTRKDSSETTMLSLMAPFQMLGYTYEIAKLAGILIRDFPQIKQFPDAGIAATALVHDAQLLTLNITDFENIPNLKLYQLGEEFQNNNA